MSTKDQTEEIDAIHDVADQFNTRPRSYSGRGMNGKRCWAIASQDHTATEVIEAAAQKGLTGARSDSLGLGVIVYWPHLKHPGQPMDEE